jgi:uncharacterized protein YneF (UPF0154 family)
MTQAITLLIAIGLGLIIGLSVGFIIGTIVTMGRVLEKDFDDVRRLMEEFKDDEIYQ